MYKRLGVVILATLLFIFAFTVPAFGADSISLEDSLDGIVSYYENNQTTLDSWEVIGLANAGINLSVDTWQLPDWDVDPETTSVGNYAKTILAIKAVGQDPTDINGRNLCQELANKQNPTGGHFGVWFTDHIWSVVALDAAGGNYNVSEAIDYIINNKKSDGGYAVSGVTADPDTTGFTLIALANHTEIEGVNQGINEAKDCLYSLQLDTGGFSSTMGGESAESNSAIIRGLLAGGFNATIISEDWTKNGNTMIDALFAFQLEDKSFSHELEGGSNRMATYQSFLAIADLAKSGFGDYVINRNNSNNDQEPSGQIGITVRVEGLEDTGTILEETEIQIAAGSKVFDALKQALDDAGINNSIDPTADWLNTGDINVNIPQELSSSLYWMYVVNDDLSTGANPELKQDDNINVYLSYYSTEWSTAYAKLTVDKNEAKKGETVTVTVQKSNGGWPATYIPAEGVTVHFGDETYTTDANGEVEVTIQAAGTYEVYAEKYNESGIPEIVNTARKIVTVKEASSGTGVGSNSITVQIAVVGKEGNILYGPRSVRISEDDEFNLTAMSALNATSLSWTLSDSWDGLVVEIAGEANEGMNGWMYSINGSSASDVPQNASVSNGDKIIFWYSMSAMSDGPTWAEVSDGTIKGTATGLDEIKMEIKESLDKYNSELDKLKETTVVINADDKMTQKAVEALKKEMDSYLVNLSQKVGQEEDVIANKEVSILVPQNTLSQDKILTIKELALTEESQLFRVKLGSSVYEFGPSGTKFDKPITISFKVAITEDMSIEDLTPAWYDETSKQWIPLPGLIDLEAGLVVFRIDHFTKFALIELPKPTKVLTRITFEDVDDNIAWAKDAIEILAGQGVIKGMSPGIFEPQRSISRAELVQLVVNGLQLKTEEYQNGLFNDVDSSHWFAASVVTAYKNKIISGYPDCSFKPNNSISRNELASILHYIEGTTNSRNDVKLEFKDVDNIPEWALNGVKYVFEQEIMNGYEDGTFKGSNPLSRAEAAVVIYKYLNSISKI
ncbi:MAG: S-layer homology domain-containing protein [Syntrophomonadaceae bacterium]|nr:S-layer homology domain-containing protein [Syntrophomonadaceae bacterium]